MDTILEYLSSVGAYLNEHPWAQRVLASVLVVFACVMAQVLLQRMVRRASIKAHDLRRRWLVQVRNVCILVALLGLVIIWGSEIRTLALSLVAFLVALVIGTKELILCILGGLYKVLAAPFVIGDRIRIGDYCGEVIDQHILSTHLLELSTDTPFARFTGRTVVLPNALLLTQTVRNDNLTARFTFRSMTLKLKRGEDWQAGERVMLEAANAAVADFLPRATKALASYGRHEEVEMPSAEPVVKVELPDADHVALVLRFPVPVNDVSKVEQAIVRQCLAQPPFSDSPSA